MKYLDRCHRYLNGFNLVLTILDI